MAAPTPNPRVGVAAALLNAKGELLLGKRVGSHGSGTWQFPGGHLEYGESFLACAERETLEETGLKVKGLKLIGVTNDVFEEAGKHYITLFVACKMEDSDATPEVLEPQKCEGWYWVRWDEVCDWCDHHDDVVAPWADKKCFLPIRNLVKENRGINFNVE